MKNLLLIAVSILLLASAETPAKEVKTDEDVLRHMKTVLWPQAYRTQDVKLLDTILHDSFQMIDNDGNRSTKSAELDYISKNKSDPANFVYTIERLDIYDNQFAVVDGTGNTDSYQYKSSNYLIKVDGKWRAISSHVSGFKRK